jgi:hypothetical protein
VFYNVPGTDSESTEEKALRAEMGLMTEREMTSSLQEDEARKRVRVDEPEAPARVATSTVTIIEQSTTTVMPLPAAIPEAAQAVASTAPARITQEPPISGPTPSTVSAQSQAPAREQHPEAHAIGHGSLSVQAVPPPVVLPPDPTTHLPVPGLSAAADADEDDDFEMPEINLESDTDEDDEE